MTCGRGSRFVRSAAAAAVLIAAAPAVWMTAPAAEAVDVSTGRAGFCPGDDGVTVVVDFQQLAGQTIVRCAPGSQTRTGLEVLHEAGFQVEGVQRWGESFVCRIENRPAASEPLAVAGDAGYREPCVDTPPPAAFWSYWHATDGGRWQYSQVGVKNSRVGPGGFEGWSFSLNADGAASPPGTAPERPAVGAGDHADRSGSAPADGRRDEGSPRAAADWTGGAASPDLREDQSAGSAWSSVLGLGAVAAVAALAAAASARRRRRRSPPLPQA